jgi:putative flippase GtrA
MITTLANLAGRYGLNPKEAERFLKFLVVGTIGFIVDFGVLTVLVEVAQVPHLVERWAGFPETVGLVAANTVSFTLAVLSNFTLNRYWTYPESRTKKKRIQLPQFVVVSVIGLLLNNTILAATHNLFDPVLRAMHITRIDGYIPAKMLATAVVLFWNFYVNRRWTYSNVG